MKILPTVLAAALVSLSLTACGGGDSGTATPKPNPVPTPAGGITRLTGTIKAAGAAGRSLNLVVIGGSEANLQVENPVSVTISANSTYNIALPVPTVSFADLTSSEFASGCNITKNVDSAKGVKVASAELYLDKSQPLTYGVPSNQETYERYELLYVNQPFTREVIADCGNYSYQTTWNMVKGWNMIKNTFDGSKILSTSSSPATLNIDLYGN